MHTGPGLVTRGVLRMVVERPEASAAVWRPLADRTYARPQLFFSRPSASAAGAEARKGSSGAPSGISALRSPLPPNVQLITLQLLQPRKVLLRLAHQFGIGEDAVLATPVKVRLTRARRPTRSHLAAPRARRFPTRSSASSGVTFN